MRAFIRLVVAIVCLGVVGSGYGGTYSGGAGTQEDPYQISSVGDWQELIAASGDWDKQFILLNDIDFGGGNLKPVGNRDQVFVGVFDGNSHVLRNGVINLPNTFYVGLFGCLGTDSEIRNLGAEGTSVIGHTEVGGLCGSNGSWNRAGGTITNCYVTGSVFGYDDCVGGLCGTNEGTISNCYVTGQVDGTGDTGGLCGFNGGTISNCYATTGAFRWRGDGLCGMNVGGTISGCFWDIETSGQPSSYGGTGKTTAQMKTLSTFSSWDFINTWDMGENQTYPYLRTHSAADLNKDKTVNILDLSIMAEQWLKEE